MATTGTNGSGPDIAFLAQKYEEEKAKRFRADGNDQYLDLEEEASSSAKLAALVKDPWIDHEALNAKQPNLSDGDDVKFLILGAGFCGLCHAVQFLEAGFKPQDMRLVDAAGDFGGTWYYNRYPGLQCDSESLTYLPFLEEMGYMPKHKYSQGEEIRQHARNIAKHWALQDQAVFRTQISKMDWDEGKKRWVVVMRQDRGSEQEAIDMTVTTQFLVLGNGVLEHPKIPKLEGLESFQGDLIHTGRWNYDISGGSYTDPSLTRLEGKKVGLVGTGATGIQCAAAVSKWAGHLTVFQRTPSSVAGRGQKEMNPEEFKKATSKAGWWDNRNNNYAAVLNGGEPQEDLVNDEWSSLAVHHVLIGGPSHKDPLDMAAIPGYVGQMIAADAPRTESMRKRVEDTVKDEKTAEALKAWYPSWCKRPCFNDDFLPMFNRDNVTLVQTEPTGLSKATAKGLVNDGTEYDLDVIIFATGYRGPAYNMSEPSKMSNTTITGRNGLTISQKWADLGPTTLHGVFTSSFPNLILTGPAQAASSPSFTYSFDIMSRHAAHVVAAAHAKSSNPDTIVIEPEEQAEEEWATFYAYRAGWAAPIGACLPSYLNNEGKVMTSMEEGMKMGRGVPYPEGINEYAKVLKAWREEGSLKGVKIA